jgi:hypothetical protein
MNIGTLSSRVAAVALVASYFAAPANAVPVLCEDTTRNHMYIDSVYVSSCVDAGVGNVNGNPGTDDFLLANPGLDYTGIGDGDFDVDSQTQTATEGTFEIDSGLWSNWTSIAIGFKFGTGGLADQWFVYLLNSQVSSGAWDFVNVYRRGGGLSHIQLYGVEPTEQVPEPGTLGLLGVGIFGLAMLRRFKKTA